jgi:acyl-CoA synthetase (AMP-forming)/AMP-acid ligase II
VAEPNVATHETLSLPALIQSFPEALTFWAEQTPDAPALRALDGRVWTHGDVRGAVAGIAGRFAMLGVQPDAPIALILPPGAEACLALLGASVAAVAAPLNPKGTVHELRRDLRRLGTTLVVTGGPSAAAVEGVAVDLGIVTVAMEDLLAPDGQQMGRNDPLPSRNPDDIAVILHTSGTTALPKRVPRPHRTYVAAARAAAMCTNLTRADVGLLVARLHTNAGVGNLVASLFTGGSCVAAPGFDPVALPRWLAEHQPTWFVSTPTEIALLLETADAAGRETVVEPGSHLRAVRLGAQPMAPGLLERAERVLRAPICDGFGMTEASYITGNGPGAADRRAGSVGRPLNSEIRVLDEDCRDLPPGVTGHLVVRGETLFPGYLDDAETNAAAFLPGGWFRTGDLGHIDADGFVVLSGRSHEIINRGAEKIAPVEVDHALLAHPAVAEAAVFAVPDARLGEDIVAAVVLRPGRTVAARELRGWLLQRLSPIKVPRRIWQVERLPRTSSGKVQRGELARRWQETRG